ncbi:hypothetical protein BDV06DRAFT_136084 [Aspergillus oleicola]
MEKKHPLAHRASLNGPNKDTPTHEGAIKSHDHGRFVKKHLDLTETLVCASTKPKHAQLQGQTPYNEKFFGSLAKTIVDTFPLKAFAKSHGCEVGDVIVAIREVVVVPLSKPLNCRVDAGTSTAARTTESIIAKSSNATQTSGAVTMTLGRPNVEGIARPVIMSISKGTQTAEPTPEDSKRPSVARTTEPIIMTSSEATQTPEPSKREAVPAKRANTSISPFEIPDHPRDPKRRRTSTTFPNRSPVKQDVFGKYVTMRSKKTEGHRTPGK